jgi:hypothetical protein
LLPERSVSECYDGIESLRRLTPADAESVLGGPTVWWEEV